MTPRHSLNGKDLFCGLCLLLAVLNLGWALYGRFGRPGWFKHAPAMLEFLDAEAAQHQQAPTDPAGLATAYWRDLFSKPPAATDDTTLILAALLTVSAAVTIVLPANTRNTRRPAY